MGHLSGALAFTFPVVGTEYSAYYLAQPSLGAITVSSKVFVRSEDSGKQTLSSSRTLLKGGSCNLQVTLILSSPKVHTPYRLRIRSKAN